jgi:hypothetical protein
MVREYQEEWLVRAAFNSPAFSSPPLENAGFDQEA